MFWGKKRVLFRKMFYREKGVIIFRRMIFRSMSNVDVEVLYKILEGFIFVVGIWVSVCLNVYNRF